MIENRNRAIKFLLCLFIFLTPFHLIFAQVTITGNAKIFVGSDAVVYIDKKSFSNISIDRFSKDDDSSKKISRKIVQNGKSKPEKTKHIQRYDKPAVNEQFKICPPEPVYFFNNKNEYTSALTQSNNHLKLIGKFSGDEFSFYYNISLRGIIEFYHIVYTDRTLKFTFFIRPPPGSV